MTYKFPLPIWLYAVAGSLAVLASVPAAMYGIPRPDKLSRDIYPWFRRLHLGAIGTTIAFVALIIALVGGFLGEQEFRGNPITILIWVDMWVGLGIFSALLGNIWDFTSPLTAIVLNIDERLARRGVEPRRYPEALGCWPAVALLLGFAWLELCWPQGGEPFVLASIVLVYIDVQILACALFGAEVWLSRGEVFTVFARTLGRVAPVELFVRSGHGVCQARNCPTESTDRIGCVACWRAADSEHRGVRLRLYGAGVHRDRKLLPGGGMFVVCLLATVVFDGFTRTNRWYDLAAWITDHTPALVAGDSSGTLIRTAGMLVVSGSFALFYLLACAIVARFEQSSTRATAGRYAPALIPIAAVYFVAHYATYFIIYGQFSTKTLGDPLDSEWFPDLPIWIGIPGALVWTVQIFLIVFGHVVAVFEAHRIARSQSPAAATNARVARAHSALTALMIGYTGTGLWILAESIRG